MKQSEYPQEILELLEFGKKRNQTGPKVEEYEENSTLPEELVKVRHTAKPCEDCAEEVVDRRVTMRHNSQPKPYWRIHCNSCQLYKNPESGAFDLTLGELRNYYRGELHPTKGRPAGSLNLSTSQKPKD